MTEAVVQEVLRSDKVIKRTSDTKRVEIMIQFHYRNELP